MTCWTSRSAFPKLTGSAIPCETAAPGAQPAAWISPLPVHRPAHPTPPVRALIYNAPAELPHASDGRRRCFGSRDRTPARRRRRERPQLWPAVVGGGEEVGRRSWRFVARISEVVLEFWGRRFFPVSDMGRWFGPMATLNRNIDPPTCKVL